MKTLDNLMYYLFGFIIYREDLFRKRLRKKGYIFKQSEYCTKDNITVELDFYPYMVICGEKSIRFKTIYQFNRFVNNINYGSRTRK